MISLKFQVLVCLVVLCLAWEWVHADDPCRHNKQCPRRKGCYRGRCICLAGFFLKTDKNCTKVCSNGFGTTYIKYEGANMKTAGFKDIESPLDECMEACNANPACTSFIFNRSKKIPKCSFYKISALEAGGNYRDKLRDRSKIYFQRNCA